MTEDEKKLLQAKHRLEEAEARNRVRERKARTRRLIQEGAVLEKVFPQIVTVELEKLEEFLHSRMRTDFKRVPILRGFRGAKLLLLPVKGALTHHRKGGGTARFQRQTLRPCRERRQSRKRNYRYSRIAGDHSRKALLPMQNEHRSFSRLFAKTCHRQLLASMSCRSFSF